MERTNTSSLRPFHVRKIRKYSVFYFLRNQWKSCYEEVSYFHGIKSILVTIVLVKIVNFSRKEL